MFIACTANSQVKKCFVLGSTQNSVRTVQGIPSSVYKTDGQEIWNYGQSSVSFKNGLVSEFDNYSKNLKVCKEVTPVASKEMQEKQGYLFPERSKSKATKASTQEWILEKLNTYVNKNIYIDGYYSTVSDKQYPGRTLKNTTFSIESNNLTVRYFVEDQRDPHEERYTIPIADLKRLHNDMGSLVLTAKSNSIIHTAGREAKKENVYSVKFDFLAEPDLKTRLVSAFAHLQKFYKAGKKEVF